VRGSSGSIGGQFPPTPPPPTAPLEFGRGPCLNPQRRQRTMRAKAVDSISRVGEGAERGRARTSEASMRSGARNKSVR
jgi:hypothetical protein